MDIEILVNFQNMREGAPDIITGFLSALSLIADGPGLVAVVLIVYWCISKRTGQFAITAFMTGNLITQFLKNMLCIYRPWVRDVRIKPYEAAIEGAGGYSFPSGHTTGATTSLGSIAWLARQRYRILSIVLLVIVALIIFSRMYLGVHTPQDVLVGLGVGILAIWLTIRFFDWIEANSDKDLMVVIIAIAVAIVTLIIVALKPYPLDYVNGVLLVDPLEMQKGSFEAAGVIIGVSVGWLLERRMVQFSTDSSDIDLRGRAIRGAVGIVLAGVTYLVGNALFKAVFGLLAGKLIAMAALTFVAMFVVPFVFTWLEQTRFVPFGGAVPAADGSASLRGRSSERNEDARDGSNRHSLRDLRDSLTGGRKQSAPSRDSRTDDRGQSGSTRRGTASRRNRGERSAERDAWESAARAAGYDPEAESVSVAEPAQAVPEVVEPRAVRASLSDLPSPLE